ERIFIDEILPEQNFTISTRNHGADVTVTYHKGVALETEEVKWIFDVEDAVEVIP
ncbi:hypothetical protein GTO27_08780, partial [Candidatus Bathyarchaeota archaeon]|nr:hypothetical protein [Candidatus Bathyarchaeota archaeon]